MYAIVKTGGKQYKVAPGDKLNVEKIDAEVGSKVELQAICVVDGTKVEADPAKAAATKVVAVVLEQFKGEKVKVLKFKKRKNYKRCNGHRQLLTRLAIESVGAEKAAVEKKAAKPKAEKAAKVEEPKVEPVVEAVAEVAAEAVDYSKMTVAQLKEVAAEKGIKVPSGAKKAEIVELVQNA